MCLYYRILFFLLPSYTNHRKAGPEENGWLADWLAVQCPSVHCGQSPRLWQVRLSRLAGCVSRSVTSTPPKRPLTCHYSALIYHKTTPESRSLKKRKSWKVWDVKFTYDVARATNNNPNCAWPYQHLRIELPRHANQTLLYVHHIRAHIVIGGSRRIAPRAASLTAPISRLTCVDLPCCLLCRSLQRTLQIVHLVGLYGPLGGWVVPPSPPAPISHVFGVYFSFVPPLSPFLFPLVGGMGVSSMGMNPPAQRRRTGMHNMPAQPVVRWIFVSLSHPCLVGSLVD